VDRGSGAEEAAEAARDRRGGQFTPPIGSPFVPGQPDQPYVRA
jgi:hypothetical protein